MKKIITISLIYLGLLTPFAIALAQDTSSVSGIINYIGDMLQNGVVPLLLVLGLVVFSLGSFEICYSGRERG